MHAPPAELNREGTPMPRAASFSRISSLPGGCAFQNVLSILRYRSSKRPSSLPKLLACAPRLSTMRGGPAALRFAWNCSGRLILMLGIKATSPHPKCVSQPLSYQASQVVQYLEFVERATLLFSGPSFDFTQCSFWSRLLDVAWRSKKASWIIWRKLYAIESPITRSHLGWCPCRVG